MRACADVVCAVCVVCVSQAWLRSCFPLVFVAEGLLQQLSQNDLSEAAGCATASDRVGVCAGVRASVLVPALLVLALLLAVVASHAAVASVSLSVAVEWLLVGEGQQTEAWQTQKQTEIERQRQTEAEATEQVCSELATVAAVVAETEARTLAQTEAERVLVSSQRQGEPAAE